MSNCVPKTATVSSMGRVVTGHRYTKIQGTKDNYCDVRDTSGKGFVLCPQAIVL